MDISKFENLFEEIFNMFIRAEYIKRNFEYSSKNAYWLKENWDMPLKKGIIDTEIPILVMNDFVNYVHALENEHVYESIITKDYEKKFQFLYVTEQEWTEAVYKISCEYGLSFAELVHPYDMEDVFYKAKMNLLPIPAFIEKYSKDIQGKMIINDNRLDFLILSKEKEISIQRIMSYLEKELSLILAKKGVDNEYVIKNIKKIIEDDNSSSVYKTSMVPRIFGLLQWDYRLSKPESRCNLKEYKERLKTLEWPYCRKNDVCNCESDACKKQIKRQLTVARRSIEIMNLAPITDGGLNQLPEGARQIFSRHKVPEL